MTFGDWVAESRQRVKHMGVVEGSAISAGEFYQGALSRACRFFPRGPRTHIYEREWDVCILLDTLRPDALEAVAPEYEWLPNRVNTIRSIGSTSDEWMERSFTDEWGIEMSGTGHVTWNAFSNSKLDANDWAYLDEVWREVWDDERGLLPPAAITNQAMARWRRDETERQIVHYQQPHAPYRRFAEMGIVEPIYHESVGVPHEQGRLVVWDFLRRGDIAREAAWSAYLDNLRWVLDEVDRLRHNLDAEKVILTADHGESFGAYQTYGHSWGINIPELVRVPWVELEASDEETVKPPVKSYTREEVDINERLTALGYK